jgi:retinol dehydrogenase 14
LSVVFEYAIITFTIAGLLALVQVTGRHFANRRPKRSAKASYDQAAADRLWQVSAELVSVTADGRRLPR